jgi:hypothetical protein
MVPSRRYSEIGLHQSIAGLGGSTIDATSHSGPELGLISLVEGPSSAFDVGTGPSSLDRAPCVGIEPSASGEVLGIGYRISSSSPMKGLNKSSANTPGGGGSRLDLKERGHWLLHCLAGGLVELETVEFLLQPPYLLPIGVVTRSMVTQETQGFLDRFRPPEG